MSNVPHGEDWWQGTDGLWYPPMAKADASFETAPEMPLLVGGSQGSNKRKMGLVGLVVLPVLVLGGFFLSKTGKSDKGTFTGSFTLIDKYSAYGGWSVDESCNTSGGYSDINSSTQVVVKNQKGEELARTNLGLGLMLPTDGRRCIWTFSLEVPKGESYYVLTVGRRGEISYSYKQLMDGVHLSIGDN